MEIKKSKIKCVNPNYVVNPNLAKYIRKGYTKLMSFRGIEQVFTEKDVLDDKGNVNFHILFKTHYQVLDEYYNDVEFTSVPLYQNSISDDDYEYMRSYVKKNRYKYRIVYLFTEDEFNSFVLFNENTGEFINFFLIVPCGHCELCRAKKVQLQSARNVLQSCSQYMKPLFVTLTFDEKHNPGTSVPIAQQTDMLQRYHKRLRKALRQAGYSTDFKFFAVSEYGGKSGRFHYHVIYYNLPTDMYDSVINEDVTSPFKYVFRFTNFVFKSWQYGVMIRVELQKKMNIEYMTKYIQKKIGADKSTKYWKSIYLGYAAVVKNADNVIKSFDQKTFSLFNESTQHSVKIPMYSFVKKIVFPPLTKTLTKELRDKIQEASHITAFLTTNEIPRKHWQLFKPLSKICVKYLPLIEALHMDFDGTNTHTLPDGYAKKWSDYKCLTEKALELFESVDEDLDLAGLDLKDIIAKNQLYVDSCLFTNDLEFDIYAERYKAIQDNEYYINRQLDLQ